MAKRPEPPAGATISAWSGNELVSFDGATVYVQRVALGRKGTDAYPLAQISGVQVDRPAMLKLGRFRILVPGEVAPRRRQSAMNSVQDPFVVMFNSTHVEEFEALAAAIRQAQAGLQQRAPFQAAAPVQPAALDLAGQLQQLAALHAQGVLSDAEFAAAKARLLGQPAPQDQPPPAW